MRVIAGQFRSRPLAAPRGLDTRPTSDRLRETLFNVLAPRVQGAVFVDLYAGSGAVGIEALSRGAAHAIFVEQAASAMKIIRANLSALEISGSYTLETQSAAAALGRLTETARQADLIFLDPPYAADIEYSQTLNLLGGECAGAAANHAIVIAEHDKRRQLDDRYGCLSRYRVLKQGDAALSFYHRE